MKDAKGGWRGFGRCGGSVGSVEVLSGEVTTWQGSEDSQKLEPAERMFHHYGSWSRAVEWAFVDANLKK